MPSLPEKNDHDDQEQQQQRDTTTTTVSVVPQTAAAAASTSTSTSSTLVPSTATTTSSSTTSLFLRHDITSAAVAGVLARILTYPLDTCKTVAMCGVEKSVVDSARNTCSKPPASSSSCSKPTTTSSSLPSVCRTVYNREGIRGFFRGLGIAASGSAPGVALYITSYQRCKDFLTLNMTPPSSSSSSSSSTSSAFSPANAAIHLTSGVFAEAVSCLFWVPIDVIKERCQSQGPSVEGRYTSSFDALRCVTQREGLLKGVYRGYFITVGSFGPFSAVYFAAYENISVSEWFLRATSSSSLSSSASSATKKNKSCDEDKKEKNNNFWRGLTCGFAANIIACVTTNPLEMIKTRIQVQSALLQQQQHQQQQQKTGGCSINRVSIAPSEQFRYRYSGMADGLRQVAKEEGVRGLWRGLGARIAYSAPNAALTFGIYSFLKGDHAI